MINYILFIIVIQWIFTCFNWLIILLIHSFIHSDNILLLLMSFNFLPTEEFQGSTGASFVSLLPPQDLERLDRNKSFVTEACGDLSRRELLPMLASLNCITLVQRKSLDRSEDIQLLLDTIRSFSRANYDSFLFCLRKLDHVHIADLLDYGGGTFFVGLWRYSIALYWSCSFA